MNSDKRLLPFYLVRGYWGMTYLLGGTLLIWSGTWLNICQGALYLLLAFGLWQWHRWGRIINVVALYGLAISCVFGLVGLPLITYAFFVAFTGQHMPLGMIIIVVCLDALVGVMAYLSARLLRQYEPG